MTMAQVHTQLPAEQESLLVLMEGQVVEPASGALSEWAQG